MNVGDVIFEQGIYTIKFITFLPAPDYIIVNGEKNKAGHKGFEFALFKSGEPFKYYSIASGYPYNFELMKSTVIGIFKQLMI